MIGTWDIGQEYSAIGGPKSTSMGEFWRGKRRGLRKLPRSAKEASREEVLSEVQGSS